MAPRDRGGRRTFAIGTLPEATGSDYTDPGQGRWLYPRCKHAFENFLSVDESLAMRIRGATVAGSQKVPCSETHGWRAVTTIKLGEPGDSWPGERLVQVRTRDYCSDSVGAWMNYPVDYEFGCTTFHQAEWKAGNRRSICWARTPK